MNNSKKYNNSNIEWIGDIPDDWNIIKLKFIGDLKISTVNRIELDDETPVSICHYPQAYKNEKINVNTILSKGTCNEKEIDNFSLKKGQIILTKDSESRSDIGIPTFVEDDINNAVCGYHLALFTPNEKIVSPVYLFRLLQSKNVNYYFELNSNGVTRFGLGKSTILNTFVLLPPLDQQEKIATYLDYQTNLIDKIIRNKEDLIELLKEKRKSVIYEAVTKGIDSNSTMKDSGIKWLGSVPEKWPLKRVKILFKIKKQIANQLGYNVLSVTQKGIKIKDVNNYKGQLSMDYSKYQLVNRGDFIMNHMDLLTGFIDISSWEGVTSPDYRVFKLKDSDNSAIFFLYIFQICYTNKIFFGLGQGVSQLGRWRMPANQFNNFIVPCPSPEEQQKIVNYLETIIPLTDEIISKQLSAIGKLKEYRQVLISEVVTGKRNIQDLKLLNFTDNFIDNISNQKDI